jgi:hypothetical protein
MCWSDMVRHGWLSKMDDLTAFADYKIPQFLRHKKVLVYDSSLAQRVDNQIDLEPGSKEEVEIRACTIAAVEALRQELAVRSDHSKRLYAGSPPLA